MIRMHAIVKARWPRQRPRAPDDPKADESRADPGRAANADPAHPHAVSSSPGGHHEDHRHRRDMLREQGADHNRVVERRGGPNSPEEIAALEASGIT